MAGVAVIEAVPAAGVAVGDSVPVGVGRAPVGPIGVAAAFADRPPSGAGSDPVRGDCTSGAGSDAVRGDCVPFASGAGDGVGEDRVVGAESEVPDPPRGVGGPVIEGGAGIGAATEPEGREVGGAIPDAVIFAGAIAADLVGPLSEADEVGPDSPDEVGAGFGAADGTFVSSSSRGGTAIRLDESSVGGEAALILL